MKRTLGVVVLGAFLLTAMAPRHAVADDNLARNVLIGALVGAAVGGIVGLIMYATRDKTPAPTTAKNPPSFAAIGLAPLPAPADARRTTPVDPATLLRF